MTSTTVLADDIKEAMPHQTLTHILGEPSHQHIDDLKREVYRNLQSVSCPWGNNKGFTGLLRTACCRVLNNLANAAMQKNTAMDKLIQQNSALTSTIADMTLAMANMSANYVPSYKPGCANPENLDETALINTAASITVLTLKAPASTTANANVQILSFNQAATK